MINQNFDKVKLYKNRFSTETITALLYYQSIRDERSDHRPDVTSKHPRWDIDSWPQPPVKTILDQVLDYEYLVEEIVINQSRISFRIHADSGDGQDLGHSVLIPLSATGPSSTVFFDNYWLGSSTKFTRQPFNPFEYQLKNIVGQWSTVPDLRDLLAKCRHDPFSVTDFLITTEFISELEHLIRARSNQMFVKVDNRCHDYHHIINYRPGWHISKEIQNQYLSHIAANDLEGLSIDKIITWCPGDVIVFDRKQLHAAGSGHEEKIGLTIFTKKIGYQKQCLESTTIND